MKEFAATCEAVGATTKKTEKVRLVSEYLRIIPIEDAARVVVFLSGRAFAEWEERTLQVGGTLLWRAVAALSGKDSSDLSAAYRRHGDLGGAAQDALTGVSRADSSLSLEALADAFDELAGASNTAQKESILKDLLHQATALEAKYVVKIIGGDLRIGLRGSLVEEAIAKAYGANLADVQRARMMLGDLGETVRLASRQELHLARMRLFHPIGFMLASPAEHAQEAFEYFAHAMVEDKYDGIRAQAHCGGKDDPRVHLFSRTLDDVGESFPELPPALLAFPEPVVLDGEILAWNPEPDDSSTGRALPFSQLQKRLGRKKVPQALMEEIPVVYVVFDVLYAAGQLTIERPLHERRKLLDEIFRSVPAEAFKTSLHSSTQQGRLDFASGSTESAQWRGFPRVIEATMITAESPKHMEEIFEDARSRGNEGLMIKDLDSLYTPGRRGKSWLKLKRELATLDVVVTAVEWGHGKRVRVLSDYTFAIRDGDRLLDIGKAYSGLTDAEIAEMTRWFLEHTLEDQGFRRIVEPQIVIEVAFNNMMRSERHASGFALRFPRILRIRTDKPVGEIDTLDAARKIYDQQGETKR
ncbi:MAG TPA: ATP-dependent DNA ligase [Candidatus Angelobacter sp.]|nr:ATP-dependent DNA ligase [Candidatus Angelobacter sp.]